MKIFKKIFYSLFILSILFTLCIVNKNYVKAEPIETDSNLTIVGAGLRTAGNAGVRFKASIGNYNTKDVTAYGIAFAYGETTSINNIRVGAEVNDKEVIYGEVSELDGDNYFYITIYNIPETQYLQNITARAYVKYTTEYVYGVTLEVRSLAQVAYLALSDGYYSPIANSVRNSTFASTRKAYINHFGDLVINDLHEYEPIVLRKSFIKDLNESTNSTLNESSSLSAWITQLRSNNGEGANNLNCSDSKIYTFFVKIKTYEKWGWLLDFLIDKGDESVSHQLNGIKNGYHLVNNVNVPLYNLEDAITSFYNFFYYEDNGENAISFVDRESYDGLDSELYADINKYDTYSVGDTFTFTTPATMNGYDAKWTLNSTEYSVDDTYTITTNNASFRRVPTEYTISYKGTNGEDLDLTPNTYTIEDEVTLPQLSVDGYIFSGWDRYMQDDNYFVLPKGTTSNLVLYSHLTQIENYTIQYHLDGGTNNVLNPANYTSVTETFTILEPTKTGSVFVGWTINDGTTLQKTVTVEENSSLGNFELYAHWVELDTSKYTTKNTTPNANGVLDTFYYLDIKSNNKFELVTTDLLNDGSYSSILETGNVITLTNNKFELDFDETGKVSKYFLKNNYFWYFCDNNGNILDMNVGNDGKGIFNKNDTRDYGYGYVNLLNKSDYWKLQSIYRNLLAACNSVHNSNTTYTNPVFAYIDYISEGISVDQALEVVNTLLLDHPEFYWISSTIENNLGQLELSIQNEYLKYFARYSVNLYLNSFIKNIDKSISSDMNDLEKVKAIHDYIINNADYAYKTDGVTPEDAYWAHNIEGIIKVDYKKAVCEGYAKLFDLLLEHYGINSILVTGTSNSQSHMWNLVNIDNEFYYFDLTWDDPGNNNISYTYFGCSSSFMSSTHTINTSSGTGLSYLYDLPVASSNDITFVNLTIDEVDMGLQASINKAFEQMTNPESDYEIQLFDCYKIKGLLNSQSSHTYYLPSGNWPTVNSIAIKGNKIDVSSNVYTYINLNLTGNITFNCDVDFKNLILSDGDLSATIDVQNNTLTFSGHGGKVWVDSIVGTTGSKLKTIADNAKRGNVDFSVRIIEIDTFDRDLGVYLRSCTATINEANYYGNGSIKLLGDSPVLTIYELNLYVNCSICGIDGQNAIVDISNITDCSGKNNYYGINVSVSKFEYLPTISIHGTPACNIVYSFDDSYTIVSLDIEGQIITRKEFEMDFRNAGETVIMTAPDMDMSKFKVALGQLYCESLFTRNSNGEIYRDKDFYENIVNGELLEVTTINDSKLGPYSYTVPNTVTTIGTNAFAGYMNLAEINISSSVTEIKSQAFSDTSGVKKIFIPSTVTCMRSGALNGASCAILCEVSSKPSGWESGWDNSSGASVVWGSNGVLKDNGMFVYTETNSNTIALISISKNYTNKDIVIPNQIDGKPVTEFMTQTFRHKSITSIYIPNTITKIPKYAFQEASYLASVTFEENSTLSSIGEHAFIKCNALTEITIPASVTFIDTKAFGAIPSITVYVLTQAQEESWYHSNTGEFDWNSTYNGGSVTVVYLDQVN